MVVASGGGATPAFILQGNLERYSEVSGVAESSEDTVSVSWNSRRSKLSTLLSICHMVQPPSSTYETPTAT